MGSFELFAPGFITGLTGLKKGHPILDALTLIVICLILYSSWPAFQFPMLPNALPTATPVIPAATVEAISREDFLGEAAFLGAAFRCGFLRPAAFLAVFFFAAFFAGFLFAAFFAAFFFGALRFALVALRALGLRAFLVFLAMEKSSLKFGLYLKIFLSNTQNKSSEKVIF